MNEYTGYAVNQPRKPLKPYAAEQKNLFGTACILGIGLFLYIVGNNIFLMFLVAEPSRYARYLSDNSFSLASGMLHTVFDVFLSFFIVYLLLRKTGRLADLPLGKPKDSYNAVLLALIGLGGCYLANAVTSYLTVFASAFGIESVTMQPVEGLSVSGPAPAILQILGYAVFPALFEEFAYRGVILQSLRRYGDWFAIIMSSFLFGLLHGNMVQIPFAFMVGILLGYCTVASGSMWVGIVIHFGNNLLSTVQGLLQEAYGDSTAYLATISMMLCLFVLGLISFVIYAKNNNGFWRLRPSKYRYMKHTAALVLCAPTVAVSCAYFVYATLMDIVGFEEWFMQGIYNLFYY